MRSPRFCGFPNHEKYVITHFLGFLRRTACRVVTIALATKRNRLNDVSGKLFDALEEWSTAPTQHRREDEGGSTTQSVLEARTMFTSWYTRNSKVVAKCAMQRDRPCFQSTCYVLPGQPYKSVMQKICPGTAIKARKRTPTQAMASSLPGRWHLAFYILWMWVSMPLV